MKINKIVEIVTNNIFKVLLSMLLAVLAIFVVKNFVTVAYFSYVNEDDFTHAFQYLNWVKKTEHGNLFKAGIEYAIWGYNSWNGIYFSNFLEIVLGILYKEDFISFNQHVMQVNTILFFVTMYLCTFALVHSIVIKNASIIEKIFISLFAFDIILVCVFCIYEYSEIFTWFSGATSYTFPLSVFFLSFSILLFTKNKKCPILFELNMILAFLSMGGSLEVVGFSLTMIIAFVAYEIITKEEISNYSKVIIGIYFFFALFNIMAPGNIARLQTTEASQGATIFTYDLFGIIQYVYDALKLRIDLFNDNYLQTNILKISGLLLGYLIYKYNKKMLSKAYYMAFFVFIFAPIITLLPVAICYTNLKPFYLPDRVCMPLDLAIVIVHMNIFITIGNIFATSIDFLVKKFKISEALKDTVPIIIVIFLTVGVIYNEKTSPWFQVSSFMRIYDAMLNNKYEENFDRYKKIFEELEKQKGQKQVVISKANEPEKLPGILKFSLSLNSGLRQYYNIENLIIK